MGTVPFLKLYPLCNLISRMEHLHESDSDRQDHVIKVYKNGDQRSLFALKNIEHSC